MSIFPKGWGEYPPEYNRAVHGPYDPAINYGKRDTPFSEVKLGELSKWFGRQKKSPRAIAQAISRAWWRYQHKWILPKKPGPAGFFQTIAWGTLGYILINYDGIKNERMYRYH